MFIRTSLVAILIIGNVFLFGCNGSHEPDSLVYVVAIGFDKAKEPGKVLISYQIAVPRIGSSPEGGGGETKKSAKAITLQAVTLAEAYNLINSTISYYPTLSHTKMLIFSEELARGEGLQDVMGPIMRFRQYRGSMHVAIAKGTALDFFRNNQPFVDTTMSKYYENMLESAPESAYYLDSSLHTFYLRLKTFSGQAYATVVAVNPTTGKGDPADSKVPGGKAETFIAGDLPRQGGNNVEFMGTAMFRGDKMVGILDNDETRMLNIFLGSGRGYLSVVDPLEPKRSINVFLNLQQYPSIKTQIENGIPYIQIRIKLEGEITAIPSGIHYEKEEYLSLLEEQVSQVITERIEKMLRHTQEVGSDVVGFGYYFRPHFLTRPEFNAFNWNDHYSEAQIEVHVETDLKRYGLMLKSSPIQGK